MVHERGGNPKTAISKVSLSLWGCFSPVLGELSHWPADGEFAMWRCLFADKEKPCILKGV